jgi:asparagine synthase (glutamine-hydrolysing)
MVRALDEPFGDSAVVIANFLHTMVSKHVKVVLGGEGGDELFAGYQHITAHKFAKLIGKLPGFLENILISSVNRLPVANDYFSFEFKAKKFISGLHYEPIERNQIWLGSYSPQEQQKLFNPSMCQKIRDINVFEPIYRITDKINSPDNISQILLIDFNLYLPGDILTLVDRASMATSLEVRVPFLDRELVEFAINLPAHLKLKWFTSKYILRNTMQKMLPKAITKRKKIGLNIPASKWLREEMKGFVRDVFSESFIHRQNMFNFGYINKLLNDHFNGLRDNRKPIWTLMMFELWYKEYMEV